MMHIYKARKFSEKWLFMFLLNSWIIKPKCQNGESLFKNGQNFSIWLASSVIKKEKRNRIFLFFIHNDPGYYESIVLGKSFGFEKAYKVVAGGLLN